MSYLRHLLQHKWRMLFQGLPLWLALAHDCDKLWPDEFIAYARGYAHRGQMKYQKGDAFFRAWHKHQRRSKHHWQSWLVVDDDGTTTALEMPALYRREMLADWRAAAEAADTTAAWWYMTNHERLNLHPLTRLWVEQELGLSTSVALP